MKVDRSFSFAWTLPVKENEDVRQVAARCAEPVQAVFDKHNRTPALVEVRVYAKVE